MGHRRDAQYGVSGRAGKVTVRMISPTTQRSLVSNDLSLCVNPAGPNCVGAFNNLS